MTAQRSVKSVSSSGSRDELSPRERAAWDGFLRTYAAMHRVSDAHVQREHGLALKEAEVLLLLAGQPERQMRMSDLAEAVNLSASGATRLVERLERRRLVERTSCPSDRRGSFALLTGSGRALAGQVRLTLDDTVREHFLSHVSGDDLDRMTSYWTRLLEAVGQSEDGEPCAGIPG